MRGSNVSCLVRPLWVVMLRIGDAQSHVRKKDCTYIWLRALPGARCFTMDPILSRAMMSDDIVEVLRRRLGCFSLQGAMEERGQRRSEVKRKISSRVWSTVIERRGGQTASSSQVDMVHDGLAAGNRVGARVFPQALSSSPDQWLWGSQLDRGISATEPASRS